MGKGSKPNEAREHEAIRLLLNAIRSDGQSVAAILRYMLREGFTAEETQAAVNAIAKANTGD
ncbi:hypothetical protein [Dinoroseobacter sp. S124A]|uniref:hypothetical protein n=1 Tax=Dinoroseobacter sp. S124A TaxID=3415128 RepID=UPI003C7E7D4F